MGGYSFCNLKISIRKWEHGKTIFPLWKHLKIPSYRKCCLEMSVIEQQGLKGGWQMKI